MMDRRPPLYTLLNGKTPWLLFPSLFSWLEAEEVEEKLNTRVHQFVH